VSQLGAWSLKRDERELLSKFVQSEQEIDDIELALKPGLAFWWKIAGCTSMIFAGVIIGEIGLFFVLNGVTSHTVDAGGIIVLIIGICLYISGIILGIRLRQFQAPTRTFKVMIRALPKVDSALGTTPISKERKALARQLRRCARRFRYFRPFPALTFQEKVINKCAVESSRVIRNLILLTLLGNDDELRVVRMTLETAILKIGTSKWVEIKGLPVDIGQYHLIIPARRGRAVAGPFTLAVLTAIPAIPVLFHFF
jgi:hypothetical protein